MEQKAALLAGDTATAEARKRVAAAEAALAEARTAHLNRAAEANQGKLVIMTLRDIEKRKPKYASANFWGGTQKVWESGKQVEQQTDGWYEEMCLKTIKREVYSAKYMPVDPKKVDDSYQYMKLREARIAELEAQDVIDIYASLAVRRGRSGSRLGSPGTDGRSGLLGDLPGALVYLEALGRCGQFWGGGAGQSLGRGVDNLAVSPTSIRAEGR